ncbi:MAG: hypothetical protein IAF94_20420 [Pirellulaceae bacterium]|nr:hypothetical protein [Pirellulaceae bacterium]
MVTKLLVGDESTSLNLLTRDGAVAVSFPVRLTGKQYAKLHDCLHECGTKQALRECIAMVAKEWGIEAIIDDA